MIAAGVARWRALSDGDQVQAHGLALSMALFLVHFAFYSWWFIEDAAITFAFARNAAIGEGLVAYPGGERVEGFSNPSWTLLLAFLRLLGVSPWVGAKLAGAVLGAATLVVAWAWARRLLGADSGRWPLLVPLLLATTPQHVLWCASGLENPLFGFLLATGGLLLVREVDDGAPPWSALPWFGLAITRPEAPMYVAVAGGLGFVLIAGRRGARDALSWALRWGALLGVPFVAWHAARIGYFAWEFPNTYYAKLAEEERFQPLKWDTRGWEYLRKWALWTTQGFLIPVYLLGQTGRGHGRGVAGGILVAITLLLLVPGLEWPGLLVPAWKAFEEPQWLMAVRVAGFATVLMVAPGIGLDRPGATPRVLGWALLATGLFFALYSGGDWMAGFRWINPVVVPLAVLFTDGLREIGLALAGRPRAARGVTAVLAAAPVVAGVILAGTHVGAPETSPYDVRRRVAYMHHVGARVDAEHPTQMEVDMGAHLWWFEGPLIDMAGLVDVPMAHHHWEKPFVAQYVYEERRPEFAHVHAFWAKKTQMTGHRMWRRDYLEIPDVPLSPRRTHTGNHVRRDLVFTDRWPGSPERRTEFDGRLVLEGLDTPIAEVGPGETLFVEVGWRRRKAGSRFRAWVFAAGEERTVAWEIPPGYDWTQPVSWRTTEVITGRHRLPLPADLPPGRYDLGLVVATEGADAGILPPTTIPQGARTDAPRYAAGEVRWDGALTVLSGEDAARAFEDDVDVALAGADRGDCTAAEDAWDRLRRRRPWGDPEVGDARERMTRAVARCYARWAAAVDPADAVDALVAARWWDHRDPVVLGVARVVADALVAEGERAEADGDAGRAYAAWRDALAVDPTRAWVRRRAEAARDRSLGLDTAGSTSAPDGSG